MKAILVHLDDTARCRTRLEIAAFLARRFNAHLTGFYATSGPYFAPDRVITETLPNATESLFTEKTAGLSSSWLNAGAGDGAGGATDRTIRQAFYADLVIVGQADAGSGQRSVPLDFPERLVLGAGRPVLVIPNTGEFRAIGERVMVAWRGGKASSRALNDALPFLAGASEVHISMVNPRGTFEKEGEDLCNFLARHGIRALADQISANDVSAGNILLNQACDLGIDLIVLGVLPRHRFGAVGLGPVGKHFLEHMTIPALMSN
jgi:nucleotide-binding universal stress UspA family protein